MADKNKKENGYWYSLENGTHIHVGKGETPKEAADKAISKIKKGSKGKQEKGAESDNFKEKVVNGYVIGKSSDNKFTVYNNEGHFEEDKNNFYDTEEEAIKRANSLKKGIAVEDDEADDFDADLEAAFKKHKGDENKILDELRANGKDYGMSNSDLQGVVESYVMRHFDDDFEEEFEEEDWGTWAVNIDKKVPENWESDGWDGDSRFYNVKNQKGVRSVSTNQEGRTTIYTENGAVSFNSLDEAKEFMNLKTKQEAEDYLWDKLGYITETAESAYDDMFDEFEEDTQAQNPLYYEKQPDGTIKESWNKDVTYKNEKDLEDKAGSGALNHVREKEEIENKPKKSEIITEDKKEEFLKANGLDKDFYFDGSDLVDAKTGEDTGIVVGRNGAEKDFLLKRINEYKKQPSKKQPSQNGPLSYDQAKKLFKEKNGVDLTEDAYKTILEMFGGKK